MVATRGWRNSCFADRLSSVSLWCYLDMGSCDEGTPSPGTQDYCNGDSYVAHISPEYRFSKIMISNYQPCGWWIFPFQSVYPVNWRWGTGRNPWRPKPLFNTQRSWNTGTSAERWLRAIRGSDVSAAVRACYIKHSLWLCACFCPSLVEKSPKKFLALATHF